MKAFLCACGFAMALALATTPARAQAFPRGGITLAEMAQWLRTNGYQEQSVRLQNGRVALRTAAGGYGFYIHFYDCNGGPRCASLQFRVGFSTHGRYGLARENTWNGSHRWAYVHTDIRDDPWLTMDVDLYPGGNCQLLGDEFGIWRHVLNGFAKSIHF